jgi:hypothetical protein
VPDAIGLLGRLQQFLDRRRVDVATLDGEGLVTLMVEWYRQTALDPADATATADVLMHQYGGWSEGCATGFKWGVVRRVELTEPDGSRVERFAGLTLMLEPSRFSGVAPVRFEVADRGALDAFVQRVERTPAYDTVLGERPMGVVLQSGGLR